MKNRSLAISRVSLKHICFDDTTFSLNPFDHEAIADELRLRIERCGILHPPIIRERTGTSYAIVSGRKRLRLASDILKLSACDCIIVPAGHDQLETLAMALDESALGGPLSPIQKATFLQKALPLATEEEIAARFLPLMDLPATVFRIRQLLALLKLEQPIAAALHAGALDLKAAQELCQLNFRDRLALFEIISSLHLSVGNQRKLIRLCRDLAKRQDTSLLSLLSAPEIEAILRHPEANVPQKSRMLMQALARNHSPRLAAAEKEFSALPHRLKLPNWATLSHAPAFEKDTLTLTLTFDDVPALESFWKGQQAS